MKIAFVRNPKTGSSSIREALPKTVFTDAHRPLRKYEQGYTTIVFVRNPWERLFSWWRHQNYCKTETFKDYVMRRALTERYKHGRWMTDLVIANQWEWVRDSFRGHADHIGRFEHMAEDFEHICLILGIDAAPLGHRNKSIRHETYPHDPDAWDAEMVAHMDPMFGNFAENFRYEPPL